MSGRYRTRRMGKAMCGTTRSGSCNRHEGERSGSVVL